MKRLLPAFLGIFIILFVGFLFFQKSHFASAATANHVVISEVQTGEDGASTHDFIELYNPTASDVDLKEYRLVKRSSTGDADDSIVAFNDGDVIPANGYFLWCNNDLVATLSCDRATSATIADNNSIGLRDGAIDTGALVDAVTFGTVINTLGEGNPLTNPEPGQSVERKANASSTTSTMAFGGPDEANGNGEDTENNINDFVVRVLTQSQNKASGTETPGGATATPMPTITPSASPTMTPSVNPSATASPTPSNEPSASPTMSPMPSNSPTVSPTNMPSVSPTSTPTTSPTMTPTVTLSPTPGIPTPTPKVIVHGPIFRCQLNYTPVRFFHMIVLIPHLSCERITF